MRVTSNSFPTTLKYQLNKLAVTQSHLQVQAATGQRFRTASEDPKAMRKVLEMQTETKQLGQYNRNIEMMKEGLDGTYGAVDSLKKVLDRAGEIASMADGMKSPDQLNAYMNEVNQLIEQAVQIGNTRTQFGFIFAGTKSNSKPFEAERDTQTGKITKVAYQGSDKTIDVEIGDNVLMSVQVPGGNDTGTGNHGLFIDDRHDSNLIQNLINLRDHLENGEHEQIGNNILPAMLQDEDNIIYHISSIGAQQSRLEAMKVMGQRRMGALEGFISKEADSDLAQTLVRLNEIQASYLAALKSGGTIMGQSLLDYI